MSAHLKRLLAALGFFVWMAFMIAAYYVAQKPLLLAGVQGLAATLWALFVWGLFTVNAAGLGNLVLKELLKQRVQPVERILLGTGIGLGLLGLAGFLLGIIGGVHPALLLGIQGGLLVFLWWRKGLQSAWADVCALGAVWRAGMAGTPLWLKIALACTLLIAFLLALAPPAEAFDALFYHLVAPARFLSGEGMQPSRVPHFWFPALPEGLFLWAQGLGAVRTTQLLHLTWALLTILLLWYWAVRVWTVRVAQRILVILLSMPSLYLLASWAYTDLALTFYGLAALYGVYRAFETESQNPQTGWVMLAGLGAGMAMGVKYTSFLVPVSVVLLMLWWGRQNWGRAFKTIVIFSLCALGVAAPWYARSWFVMGNPFYPFAFGGADWDAFRSAWYAEAGTGIGWNLKELILLPLNATLGHRDANFYDGRIGPLYLTLLPLTTYIIFKRKDYTPPQRKTLLTITFFTLFSLAFWVFGVINSAPLWQTRLLFPALIPFALPTALGLLALQKLDTPQLRISFIFEIAVIAVVAVTVMDAGASLIMRNPLAYAMGGETEAAYLAKVQPAYAQALRLLDETPTEARVYFLLEPRSYGAPRDVQIDPILDNFPHAWYLHQDTAPILQSWQADGYTHLLVYRRGLDFLVENQPARFPGDLHNALETFLRDDLTLSDSTADGAYELYLIPQE